MTDINHANGHIIRGTPDAKRDPRWYALYTRSRFEKRVARDLAEKGLESYAPFHTVIRQWSDRRKKVQVPLFSCYVFVRTHLRQRMLAVETAGVAYMVSVKGVPAAIPDAEIQAVKRLLDGADRFETAEYLPIGQQVEIVRGPFAGIRGRLVEHHGTKRLVVGIQCIRQSISVEISQWDVKAIEASSCHAGERSLEKA